jgi:DNA-binding XRE family transcriptional regulator
MFAGCQRRSVSIPLCAETDQQILRLIGQRIRAARLRGNLTQECVAELVGVHWKTIGHIERGSYPIALTIFVRLSQFLETSPNRLLDGLRLPAPERTARIKKALVRKRAPARRQVKAVEGC